MRWRPRWPAISPSAFRRRASTREGKKAEAKQKRTHDLVLRQAHDYARGNKLNVYTKARLANQFKWALLEAGYPKSFVDAMTYELATVVAAAQSRRRVTRSPL